MEVLDIIIPFVGGLGMFIYGMQTMAQGLENAAGDRMRSMLEILTKNKLLGVILGFAITAVIQSSSATTVMVVGFVNAGMMNLQQAMGVIMGANIGTTVTGWLVSSTEWAKFFSPSTLAPVAVIIGVFIMLTGKRYATKEIAKIIFGFGLLFIGISTMSQAVEPLKHNEEFCNIFVSMGNNPLYGIAAGAFVTAIIQSSSASVGILQSLAAAGLVPFEAAIYIIMGQNIGTCVTAILSGLGANRNAKTTGIMHLLFNLIGTAIFGVVTIVYFNSVNPAWAMGNITQTQISLIHTMFNFGTTIILFPVSDWIIKLAKIIGKADSEVKDEDKLSLDQRLLETPGIALTSLNTELIRMGQVVQKHLSIAEDVLISPDESKIRQIKEIEKSVDRMTSEISNFTIELSSLQIGQREHRETMQILQVVSDMERISDQCENIAEYAEQMIERGLSLSDEAKKEISQFAEVCVASYNYALKSFIDGDQESAMESIKKETEADKLEIVFRARNVERLTGHRCEAGTGIIFQDALVSFERISDHARNIAEERDKSDSNYY